MKLMRVKTTAADLALEPPFFPFFLASLLLPPLGPLDDFPLGGPFVLDLAFATALPPFPFAGPLDFGLSFFFFAGDFDFAILKLYLSNSMR